MLADGVVRSLDQAGYAVDRADTGPRGDAAMEAGTYDLVVLDIGLPGMDGFELLRRWRQKGNSMPVLILTARDDVDDRVHGLDLGADDYLVKPFALRELKARIRALVRRGRAEKDSRFVHGPLVLDTLGRRAWLQDAPLDLTAREWHVLEFLLTRAGRVVSKDDIVESLCNWDKDLSLNAVEVYVSRLRAKLESAGIRIRTIRGFGYLLEEPVEDGA